MNIRLQHSRGQQHRPTPVLLWSLATLLLPAATAASQTLPVRSSALPTPRFAAEPAAELSFSASPPSAPRPSPRVSPARAFRVELREEAIDYRYTNRWANADEALAGDRPVREGRARAAESMLADAAGAALEVIARDAFNKPRRKRQQDQPVGLRHQLRLDSSPSWRLRTSAGLTRLRIDVPLSAHDDFAFTCSRRVDLDSGRRELGASVRMNPWDESIRFGFELEF